MIWVVGRRSTKRGGTDTIYCCTMYPISNFIQTNIGPNFIRSYWIYLFTDSDQYLHQPLISRRRTTPTDDVPAHPFPIWVGRRRCFGQTSGIPEVHTHKSCTKSFPWIRYCLPKNKNVIELRNCRGMLQVEARAREGQCKKVRVSECLLPPNVLHGARVGGGNKNFKADK